MIYSTEKANTIQLIDTTTTNTSNKYLMPGIHENVELVGARVDKSFRDNIFLEIKFQKDGLDLTHTEWEPNKKPLESEEAFQIRGNKQVKRMLQILKCFYKEEQLVFTGSSFKEFAGWVTDLLNNADKNIKVRAKVVYNKKGFTTLPNYSTFMFMEPMILPEGETSKITRLNIDLFEKPIVADVEKDEDNSEVNSSEIPTSSTTAQDATFMSTVDPSTIVQNTADNLVGNPNELPF